MKNVSWDDLRIFIQVAEGGALSAAARQLDISVATTGRRMLALEEALGRALFVRSNTGYSLTKAGEDLLLKVRPMKAATRPLEEWLAPEHARPIVRISAGTGTAGFLADNISQIWRPNDPFKLAFITSEVRLDIAHREVEIGIRNQPPQAGNLASRRLRELRFAPFKNRHREWPDEPGWVAIDAEHARHPASRWVLNRTDISIDAWASSVATLHRLIYGGAGVGVMPCFVGDRDQVLARAGPVIEELTESQWIVMHGDDRHRQEVRMVIERIAVLFEEHAALFAGERALSD